MQGGKLDTILQLPLCTTAPLVSFLRKVTPFSSKKRTVRRNKPSVQRQTAQTKNNSLYKYANLFE